MKSIEFSKLKKLSEYDLKRRKCGLNNEIWFIDKLLSIIENDKERRNILKEIDGKLEGEFLK